MRFWDSSAIVPLFIQQPASTRAERWFADDPVIALWTLTPVEVVSALRRLVREKILEEEGAHVAELKLDGLVGPAHVVMDVDAVKALARRHLRIHLLRASDALQLGAAVRWAEGHPDGRILHTLDTRLAVAAQREGFVVPD